eukprot:236067_1
MADDTQDRLAISVELHESKDDKDTKKENYNNFDPSEHAVTSTANNKGDEDSKANDATKQNDDSSLGRLKNEQSVKERKQKLRVVVDDMWQSTRNLVIDGSNKDVVGNGNNGKKLTAHNSSLINRVTSILIDELNDDTQQFETCVITLPKSPICALLLMESVGVFQQLERVNQMSIIATILVTIIVQTAAGGTLSAKQ